MGRHEGSTGGSCGAMGVPWGILGNHGGTMREQRFIHNRMDPLACMYLFIFFSVDHIACIYLFIFLPVDSMARIYLFIFFQAKPMPFIYLFIFVQAHPVPTIYLFIFCPQASPRSFIYLSFPQEPRAHLLFIYLFRAYLSFSFFSFFLSLPEQNPCDFLCT